MLKLDSGTVITKELICPIAEKVSWSYTMLSESISCFYANPAVNNISLVLLVIVTTIIDEVKNTITI
jgi:hypothetical protein